MTWLFRLVRAVFLGFVEFGFAVLKLAALLIALLLTLLAWVWMILLAILRGKYLFPEEQDEACGRLPEAIIRRPDPAIYSQRLLMAQGLPVTWDNPDIWIAPAADPGAIEPDSYHLDDDTDYIVTVRAHNAGTDAAIGVRVRLRYRPWSFNSPDEVPVEIDASGLEVVRFVNIPPLGSALAQFAWHTPPVPAGSERSHYCLQASLYHPMDTNTANNMGQENTDVWRSPNPGLPDAGDLIELEVPLHNFADEDARFAFAADTYAVDVDERVELRLRTTLGAARLSLAAKAASLVPSLHFGHRRSIAAGGHNREHDQLQRRSAEQPVSFPMRHAVIAAKNRYVGFDSLRESILERDYSLPAGMEVAVDGGPLTEGVVVGGKVDRAVIVTLRVPPDAHPGQRIPVNLIATTVDGALAGGVTVIIQVRED